LFADKFGKGAVEEISFEDVVSGLIKIACGAGTLAFSALVALQYIVECPVHVLYPLLPLCTNTEHAQEHWGIVILAVIQFLYTAVMVLGVVLYLDILTSLIFFGAYIGQEMT